jgi:hypothetical protein
MKSFGGSFGYGYRSSRLIESDPVLALSVSLTKAEIYSSEWRRLLLRSVIAVLLLAGLMALTALTTGMARSNADGQTGAPGQQCVQLGRGAD